MTARNKLRLAPAPLDERVRAERPAARWSVHPFIRFGDTARPEPQQVRNGPGRRHRVSRAPLLSRKLDARNPPAPRELRSERFPAMAGGEPRALSGIAQCPRSVVFAATLPGACFALSAARLVFGPGPSLPSRVRPSLRPSSPAPKRPRRAAPEHGAPRSLAACSRTSHVVSLHQTGRDWLPNRKHPLRDLYEPGADEGK